MSPPRSVSVTATPCLVSSAGVASRCESAPARREIVITQPCGQSDGPELLDARIGNVKLQNQPSRPRPRKGHRELALGPAETARLCRIQALELFWGTRHVRQFLAAALPDRIGLNIDHLRESNTAPLRNREALNRGSRAGQCLEKRFGRFGELAILGTIQQKSAAAANLTRMSKPEPQTDRGGTHWFD